MTNIVTIRELEFGYDSNPILQQLNIDIQEGDFVTLIGDNGSGKSTLLKCITNLIKGYDGEIEKPDKIGYLPQRMEMQSNFPASVMEVVMSGTLALNKRKLFYSKKDRECTIKNLKAVGIFEVKDKCFRDLSVGQQQRVLIARALCATEKLLILDEPANGLDWSIAEQIYKLLADLNEKHNMTIIMVTHDIQRALNYCNKVLLLKHGAISFEGTSCDYLEVFST